ncbi:MAG: DUF2169 domain-containing protein [Byssovorax sp.]
MDAPDLDNRTSLVAAPRMLMAKDGERLCVIVKATLARALDDGMLSPVPRAERRGVRGQDIPWADPEKSSIKYPSDLCLFKPGTDVIVVAAAHAPGGKAVPSFDAGIRAGTLSKVVRIFGLRVWAAEGSSLTAPRPTTGVELRYDHAFGGLDLSDPKSPLEEPRNPVGRGIARDLSALTHQPAPMIEDPQHLLSSAHDRPAPAGLGAIGRHWAPRRHFLGTYDAAWLKERAPLLPLDHDDRESLCASPGLTASPPFIGGEEVALMNLTPGGGTTLFRLPKMRVSMRLRAPGREPETLTPHVDTVLIDTLRVPESTDVIVELVWRAAFRPPRRMKDAKILVTAEEAT